MKGVSQVLLLIMLFIFTKIAHTTGQFSYSPILASFLSHLPAESNADKATGLEALHEHHHLEVGHTLDLGMGGLSGVLLDNADALLEEVGVHGDTVLWCGYGGLG